MRVGIIGSSGGAALKKAIDILGKYSSQHEFLIITDRECGMEDLSSKSNIKVKRIIEKDNREFSTLARNYFRENGPIDMVLLFFSRLVTSELYENYPTLNIHPALLPSFKGMGAVEQFYKSKAKYLGSTLHLVNHTLDEGPIIAQTIMPVDPIDDMSKLNKYSYIQKVYLSLLAIELFEQKHIIIKAKSCEFSYTNKLPYNGRSNPSIQNTDYINEVKKLEQLEKVVVMF